MGSNPASPTIFDLVRGPVPVARDRASLDLPASFPRARLALALRGPHGVGAQARPLAPLAVIGAFDVTANGLFGWASTLGLLSVVSVLGSVYPVMTVLLARLILKERMTPTQGAGVAAAFGGIALLVGG